MTPSHRHALAGLALALITVSPAVADAAIKVDGKPKIAFFADGSPGFLSLEGDTNPMTAADDGTKLIFTVPMSSVKTGIEMRDGHMNNEYVDVAHFPNAVLACLLMATKAAAIFVGAATLGGPNFMTPAHVGRIAARPDEAYRQKQLKI